MSEPLPATFSVSLTCPDRPGIVHALTGALVRLGCNVTESQQFSSPDSGTFFMRITVDAPAGTTEERLREGIADVSAEFSMDAAVLPAGRKMRTLILASKDEHCINRLLFAQKAGSLPIEVPAVVSNHAQLGELASFYGVDFHHIPVTPETKPEAEAQLLRLVDELDVELVVLARYMQILSPELAQALAGRAINIHHSFLPSFKGARPYHQAHARGVKIIGATAHYVTDDLDEGPIIEQETIPVSHHHTAAQFVEMGREAEGRTLAAAVRLHAEHRILLDGRRTVVFR
ncbi:formyltetrahydrofolate deformylase [Arthrobacter sp. UM1]|uniref:formyltetrahydrofolate deformylase n=1 Tax=Arthrobacter sp. UM1 TaxID=2766776 RepID=UPI001CF6B703|nr:formyltetrahydrofolate deformylase [Arthrobacter sp. UM1]MCB4207915.1 formyltetrahydrofolate deformylase [Arthrobacter sp. UM1]